MDPLDVVAVVAGLVLVGAASLDAFDTLLATNIRVIRWSPSTVYYRLAWRSFRGTCTRIRDDARRERALALFGPASFIGLLVLWTAASIGGWGLVWWGLADSLSVRPPGLGGSAYYSGVVYFSIGFGDVVPASGITRVLTVAEALGGLGLLGLVIGYLPTLSGAYQARERQVLLLDDLSDTRITPISLIDSHVGPDGDATELDEVFRDWERWCAEVFDTHTSLPMLVLWRSKHRGQSWITALGVVTDSAITYLATVPGREGGPALRLYRQSVRLITFLAAQTGVEAPALRGAEQPVLVDRVHRPVAHRPAHARLRREPAPPARAARRVRPADGGVHRRAAGTSWLLGGDLGRPPGPDPSRGAVRRRGPRRGPVSSPRRL